jgi:hypothetical protein
MLSAVMLKVTNKKIILSVVMLTVFMLSVVALCPYPFLQILDLGGSD